MQQHIGIAVADRVSIMSYLDAANSKRSALGESMSIVANANPLVRRLISLSLLDLANVAMNNQVASSQ